MGGVGKTELALKVAHELKKDFPAQLRVDLQGTSNHPTSPETALGFVIRAFYKDEIKLPNSREELTQLYLQTLGNKPVLLLLDNAHRPEQVRPFLPPPNCALLITSRHPIILPGLTHLDLETLPPDKARELFNAIKSGVAPDIADEICNLCGYLPLAIRAAATLLDVEIDLDAADYLNELRDERKRLKEIERVNDEDLSVTASFNLSYARLNEEQQRVFRNLSAFPASFDAAAAEAICEDENHQLLSELLKRSLVNYSLDRKRYRLHDLVRVYAKDKNAEDESYAAQMHFAQYYLDLAKNAEDEFIGSDQALQIPAIKRFDGERDNIFAGQSWAEGQSPQDNEAAQICNLYGACFSHLMSLRVNPSDRIPITTAAVNAAQQIGDRRNEGGHLGDLGVAYSNLGDVSKAISFYEQALVIAREIGDCRSEYRSLGNLGSAYQDLGDVPKAISFSEQALLISREIGNRRGEGVSLGLLGNAYAKLGNLPKAISFHEQALVISREIGDRRGEGRHLANLGLAYYKLEEREKAIAYTEEAIQIHTEIQSPTAETWRKNLAIFRSEK